MWKENRSTVIWGVQNGELDTEQQSPGDIRDIQLGWFLGDGKLLFLWSVLDVMLWGIQMWALHTAVLINTHSGKKKHSFLFYLLKSGSSLLIKGIQIESNIFRYVNSFPGDFRYLIVKDAVLT